MKKDEDSPKKPHWFFWLIARYMPDSMKRKIVMIAAFCEVERMRGVKIPRIDKLNDALKLTQTEALLYGIRDLASPLSVKYFCTSDAGLCDVAAMCHGLADSVPDYLKYDTRDAMISDIAKVIVCNVK